MQFILLEHGFEGARLNTGTMSNLQTFAATPYYGLNFAQLVPDPRRDVVRYHRLDTDACGRVTAHSPTQARAVDQTVDGCHVRCCDA